MKISQMLKNTYQTAIATTAILAALVTGCSKPAEEAQSPDTNSSTATEAATGVVVPSSAVSTSSGNNADADWAELVRASRQPSIPEGWTDENPPTDEEMETYRNSTIEKARMAVALARNFYTNYPDNRNANAARGIEENMVRNLATLGDAEAASQLSAMNERLAQDPTLPEDQRFMLRFQMLRDEVLAKQPDMDAVAQTFYEGALKLNEDFPDNGQVASILLEALSVNYSTDMDENVAALTRLVESISDKKIEETPGDLQSYRLNIDAASAAVMAGDFETTERILDKLKNGNLPEEISQMVEGIQLAAAQEREKFERVGKPLELKFTAIDGREVDLSNMKGQVVMIDFWATWCQPCIIELPKVKTAYSRLHDEGFEIIGISFDDDLETLKTFVERQDMTWPHYADGKGWDNVFGKQFGIRGIPSVWLVDKNGVLRDIDARIDLESKIEALLAE